MGRLMILPRQNRAEKTTYLTAHNYISAFRDKHKGRTDKWVLSSDLRMLRNRVGTYFLAWWKTDLGY